MWSWWFRYVVVAAVVLCVGRAVPVDDADDDDNNDFTRVVRSQPGFSITHLDIRDAILILEKSIKAVINKLNRHEAREAHVADFSTKTLNKLSSDHALTAVNIQALAMQLAKMEERLLSTEALIQTTDERQRMMLNQLSQGLDRLLQAGPPLEVFPGAPPNQEGDENVLKHVKKLTRKVSAVDTFMQREMRKVTNEVKIVGESLDQHMGQLQQRHDRLSTTLDTCEAQTMQQQATGCNEGESEVASRLDALDLHFREQREELHDLTEQTHKSLDDHLTTLKMLLDESHAGQAIINASVADLTHNLRNLNITTQEGLGHFSSDVTTAIKNSEATVAQSMSTIGNELKAETSNIIDILDDRASQAENLQHIVLENYSELSAEISSLKKVEQVMINTADSVLDTKRSIEFGIQQIILELGEIVKNSGSTINSTLSDQISNISFAILKNQTSALTNMTAKMEKEISQVWRQIGIMYQQMTQSVDLLGQLKDTTKEHMNASLSRVGNMDGTVDKINTKVADVESNLNYLLGRLSLVVSEFNLMKSGVGDELMRLRENLAKENNNPVQFAGGQPTSDDDRYEISHKRHAIYPGTYPGYNPKPLAVL
ncbi:putative Centrosomal protein of 290 kDa-like 2 [Homarus americanus]|uniref:Putative Centrosomal protein of 290 kDa-like 2 n=1 Tax=Homarus americanus TaxID=6706 RepID=A0A8J5MWT9_HOMAM|nr:putative Centrosomal protein of 290 kDa-like 2 [Homarus americanus]